MKTYEGQLVAGNEKFCIILSRFNEHNNTLAPKRAQAIAASHPA